MKISVFNSTLSCISKCIRFFSVMINKKIISGLFITIFASYSAFFLNPLGKKMHSKRNARIFGHRNGVKNVRSVVNAAREFNVPYITLYAFSTENQNRPEDEKFGLMRLLEEFLKRELTSMLKDGNSREYSRE